MNSLSWLIYFAGVVSGAKELLTAFAFIGMGMGLTGIIVGIICASNDEPAIAKLVSGFGKVAFPLGLLAALVQVVIPPRDTIYMIAASEMGERVVTAPETREMLDDLRAIVSKQLKKMREDK